jgi:hypothetical protein
LFYTEINNLQYNSLHAIYSASSFTVLSQLLHATSKASIAGWLERLARRLREQKTIQKHFYMLKTRYPTVQGLFVLHLAMTAF